MDAASSKLLLWLLSFRDKESSSSEEDHNRTAQDSFISIRFKGFPFAFNVTHPTCCCRPVQQQQIFLYRH